MFIFLVGCERPTGRGSCLAQTAFPKEILLQAPELLVEHFVLRTRMVQVLRMAGGICNRKNRRTPACGKELCFSPVAPTSAHTESIFSVVFKILSC